MYDAMPYRKVTGRVEFSFQTPKGTVKTDTPFTARMASKTLSNPTPILEWAGSGTKEKAKRDGPVYLK